MTIIKLPPVAPEDCNGYMKEQPFVRNGMKDVMVKNPDHEMYEHFKKRNMLSLDELETIYG